MPTMNAMELAFSVIRDKNRVNRKLEQAMRQIDILAVEASVTDPATRTAALRQISNIAVKALVEERSFLVKEQAVRKRVRQFTSTRN